MVGAPQAGVNQGSLRPNTCSVYNGSCGSKLTELGSPAPHLSEGFLINSQELWGTTSAETTAMVERPAGRRERKSKRRRESKEMDEDELEELIIQREDLAEQRFAGYAAETPEQREHGLAGIVKSRNYALQMQDPEEHRALNEGRDERAKRRENETGKELRKRTENDRRNHERLERERDPETMAEFRAKKAAEEEAFLAKLKEKSGPELERRDKKNESKRRCRSARKEDPMAYEELKADNELKRSLLMPEQEEERKKKLAAKSKNRKDNLADPGRAQRRKAEQAAKVAAMSPTERAKYVKWLENKRIDSKKRVEKKRAVRAAALAAAKAKLADEDKENRES